MNILFLDQWNTSAYHKAFVVMPLEQKDLRQKVELIFNVCGYQCWGVAHDPKRGLQELTFGKKTDLLPRPLHADVGPS